MLLFGGPYFGVPYFRELTYSVNPANPSSLSRARVACGVEVGLGSGCGLEVTFLRGERAHMGVSEIRGT